MQSEVLGEWDVIHQEGQVETRKKDESTWTIEERGNVEADNVAGNAIGWVQSRTRRYGKGK
jgi:hypothetical protein